MTQINTSTGFHDPISGSYTGYRTDTVRNRTLPGGTHVNICWNGTWLYKLGNQVGVTFILLSPGYQGNLVIYGPDGEFYNRTLTFGTNLSLAFPTGYEFQYIYNEDDFDPYMGYFTADQSKTIFITPSLLEAEDGLLTEIYEAFITQSMLEYIQLEIGEN